MISCPLRWASLPEDGLIEVTQGKKKKKVLWWEYYKFHSEDQWLEWRHWTEDLLVKEQVKKPGQTLNYIDLRWGMAYKPCNKKEGDQLDLL